MLPRLSRFLTIGTLLIFLSHVLGLVPAKAGEVVVPVIPAPGTMVNLSPAFVPAHLQGITIHADNALQFDFLIHKGDGRLDEGQKKQEYNKLVKYFLASLTIPDQDQWVNLSPYEKNRIIEDNFGKTEMGRDLLSQDYLLKQITASLMYPESGLGKNFWDRVYERIYKEYSDTPSGGRNPDFLKTMPVNVGAFNKVWIIPDEAVVYESGSTAYILKSHLKVMLEEDYLALQKSEARSTKSETNSKHQNSNVQNNGVSNLGYSKSGFVSDLDIRDSNLRTRTVAATVIRELILPEIEREVNEGKNFAQLRQIYSGMILATWYKKALKESLLGKVYADKNKIKGIDSLEHSPEANPPPAEIYQKYLQAFKKGVYNYIKEETDPVTQQPVPRKYFAGGFMHMADRAMIVLTSKTIGQASIGDGIEESIPSLESARFILTADTPQPNAAMVGNLLKSMLLSATNDSSPSNSTYPSFHSLNVVREINELESKLKAARNRDEMVSLLKAFDHKINDENIDEMDREITRLEDFLLKNDIFLQLRIIFPGSKNSRIIINEIKDRQIYSDGENRVTIYYASGDAMRLQRQAIFYGDNYVVINLEYIFREVKELYASDRLDPVQFVSQSALNQATIKLIVEISSGKRRAEIIDFVKNYWTLRSIKGWEEKRYESNSPSAVRTVVLFTLLHTIEPRYALAVMVRDMLQARDNGDNHSAFYMDMFAGMADVETNDQLVDFLRVNVKSAQKIKEMAQSYAARLFGEGLSRKEYSLLSSGPELKPRPESVKPEPVVFRNQSGTARPDGEIRAVRRYRTARINQSPPHTSTVGNGNSNSVSIDIAEARFTTARKKLSKVFTETFEQEIHGKGYLEILEIISEKVADGVVSAEILMGKEKLTGRHAIEVLINQELRNIPRLILFESFHNYYQENIRTAPVVGFGKELLPRPEILRRFDLYILKRSPYTDKNRGIDEDVRSKLVEVIGKIYKAGKKEIAFSALTPYRQNFTKIYRVPLKDNWAVYIRYFDAESKVLIIALDNRNKMHRKNNSNKLDLTFTSYADGYSENTIRTWEEMDDLVQELGSITIDQAMPAENLAFRSTPGGIDFNSSNLDLRIKRNGNGVPLPLAQQNLEELNRIEGFMPALIGITPVGNLPIFRELQKVVDVPTF